MFEINVLVKIFLLPLIICVSHTGNCLESGDPEVFLEPRNFNPHPYREGGRVLPADTVSRRGPVLFPAAASDVATNTPSTDTNQYTPSPDSNLYAEVSRKQRLKLRAEPTTDEQANNINPQVYSELADYAAKVLKKAATTRRNGYADPSLAGQKKNYAFSYTVKDRSTGDDFSHQQTQNSKTTNGEYRVKLPDGRIQIVSYTADKNGYKADVRYADGPSISTQAPAAAAFAPNYKHAELQIPQYISNNHYRGQTHDKFYKYEPTDIVTLYPKVLQNYQAIPVEVETQYVPTDAVQIYPDDGEKVVGILGDTASPANVPVVQKVQPVQAQLETVQLQRGHDTKVPDKFIGPALASYAARNILTAYEGGVTGVTVAPGPYRQLYVTPGKYSVAHVEPRQQYQQR